MTGPSLVVERAVFESEGKKLHGCIVRPPGRGPFPAIIFNHGSEREPAPCGPPALARMYVDRGFLFFAFQRRGHVPSAGEYIIDAQSRIFASVPEAEAYERIVDLQDACSYDVEGAVRWLMARTDVDRARVAMTGISFGGIQTLLAAERGLGVRAFVAFAPAAMSWHVAPLRSRLRRAIQRAEEPIFLAQAANDYSTGPVEELGSVLNAKAPPNIARLYPEFGGTPADGHAGFAASAAGIAIWSDDVLRFINCTFA